MISNKIEVVKIHFNTLLIFFILIAVTSVFWQVCEYDFVDFDDREYVSDNKWVQKGITRDGLEWCFAAAHSANWHPLTWVSHMVDVQFFGMDAGMHHLSNLIYHLINAFLVYLCLTRMTDETWKCAFVATIFALHPMNVETVSWISQRKTLLGTCFWLIVVWSYIKYVKEQYRVAYWLSLLFYAMGLLSKPILVTLPFSLLLLDHWPLSRTSKKGLISLIVEKLPFFLLSAISSVITFLVQRSAGAVADLNIYSLPVRFQNAIVSYLRYIEKMLWPENLSAFYPYPIRMPLWQIWAAGIGLFAIFFIAISEWKRRPWIIVGWLWFLGNLFPVIGLVQVGSQSMADRYFYVPGIGLFILLTWTFAGQVVLKKNKGTLVAIAAFLVLSGAMAISWKQAHYWENSIMMYQRIIAVSPHSDMGHFGLGVVLADQGKTEEAITHYRKAHRSNPNNFETQINLGTALMERGEIDEALLYFKQLLQKHPNDAKLHNNIGIAFSKSGKIQKAVSHFKYALKIEPEMPEAHNNLGVALFRLGKLEDALDHFQYAKRLNPAFGTAEKNFKKASKLLIKK